MGNDQLEELLEAMPRIAEAVNSFTAADVQRGAFDILMKAALREQPQEFQETDAKEDESAKLAQPVRSKQKATGSKATKKAVTTKSSKKGKLSAPPVDQSLDIRPSDKTSLPDFADEKQPKNMQNQSIVIIYWLRHHANCDAIGISQIYTCYKQMGWKAPPNLRQQLHNISFKKNWLDTSDVENVSLTISGEQHVDHDLPLRSAK